MASVNVNNLNHSNQNVVQILIVLHIVPHAGNTSYVKEIAILHGADGDGDRGEDVGGAWSVAGTVRCRRKEKLHISSKLLIIHHF